ncbi:MAG: hypothetical protein HY918_04645 [Candidatus Doudnabacteria bacterium]|nr:hypothetical protein [Candidatus Doudnabacteria bacterium]
MNPRKPHELSPELKQNFLTKEYLTNFVKEDNGEKAKIFLNRLDKISDWLNKSKNSFTEYMIAKKEWERWKKEGMATRKPQAEELTQLNLDIHPEFSKARQDYKEKKAAYYQTIRDARLRKNSKSGIGLQHDERLKLIKQINEFAENLNIQAPNFENLFLPDESITVTEEDINNPDKEINYPFLEYFFTINEIRTIIGNQLRSFKLEQNKNLPL